LLLVNKLMPNVKPRLLSRHKVLKPLDFKNKEESHASFNTNGTGPFVLVSRQPGIKTTYRRNPNGWGRFDGNVQEIVYTPISNDATRLAQGELYESNAEVARLEQQLAHLRDTRSRVEGQLVQARARLVGELARLALAAADERVQVRDADGLVLDLLPVVVHAVLAGVAEGLAHVDPIRGAVLEGVQDAVQLDLERLVRDLRLHRGSEGAKQGLAARRLLLLHAHPVLRVHHRRAQHTHAWLYSPPTADSPRGPRSRGSRW
jgi:hypothetical protein